MADAPYVWVLAGLHEASPLSRLGVIDVYSTLIWTERWQEWGECVLEVPLTAANASLLVPERILALSSGRQVCRIVSVRAEDTADRDTLTVRATDMRSVFDLRAVDGTVRAYKPSDLIRRMAESCFISPTDSDRSIPCISVSSASGDDDFSDQSARLQASYCMAGERALAVERRYGFGTKMVWDGSTGLTLGFVDPSDSGLEVSEDADTLGSAVLAHDTEGSVTAALVAGQGQGDERTAVWTGSGTGILRRESAVDARDMEPFSGTVADAMSQYAGWVTDGWVRMVGWDVEQWQRYIDGGVSDTDEAIRLLVWLGDPDSMDPDDALDLYVMADAREDGWILAEKTVNLLDVVGRSAYDYIFSVADGDSSYQALEEWPIVWHDKGTVSDPAQGTELIFNPVGGLFATIA